MTRDEAIRTVTDAVRAAAVEAQRQLTARDCIRAQAAANAGRTLAETAELLSRTETV